LLAFANATQHALESAAATSPASQPSEPGPNTASPAVPTLSRQQRRLAERLAKRELRRQPELVRQVERTLLNLRELEGAL
jgi:hypothetical protein